MCVSVCVCVLLVFDVVVCVCLCRCRCGGWRERELRVKFAKHTRTRRARELYKAHRKPVREFALFLCLVIPVLRYTKRRSCSLFC